MNQKRVIATLSTLSLGLMAACNSTKTMPPSYVSDMWSKLVRQYDITPVFPPRADMQVGDIYISCEHKIIDASDSPATTTSIDHSAMWLASMTGIVSKTDANGKVIASGLLADQYASRVHMPVIPASGAAAEVPPGGLFAAATPVRLMPVSFPEFFSISASKAEAEALIPFPSVLAKAGFSYENAKNIQISVPAAESYGVPAGPLYAALGTEEMRPVRHQAIAAFRTNAPGFCKDGTPTMDVITEIYAARAINVSITLSQSTTAQAAAGLAYAPGSAQATVLNALTQFLSPAPASGTAAVNAAEALVPTPTGASAPTIDQATAFITQLNNLYQHLEGDSAPMQYPGVKVSVINGNGSGVVMSRQFDSPVVIGYRSFSMVPGRTITVDGASAPVTAKAP